MQSKFQTPLPEQERDNEQPLPFQRFSIEHLSISFSLGHTWGISILTFILVMGLFIKIGTVWLLSIPLLLIGTIASLPSAIIALSLGWFMAERLAIWAYFHAVRKALGPSMQSCYPSATPITGSANPDAHMLILGLPGAGKTKELERYQLLQEWNKIPIFIPMKYYDGFLSNSDDMSIMSYLLESNILTRKQSGYTTKRSELIGIQYLRPYLRLLVKQGRIVFLCDGLNELRMNVLESVCAELKQIIQTQKNQVIMTCRELDYQEQHLLQQFVQEKLVVTEVIRPLSREEVSEFIEHYLSTRLITKQNQDSTPDENQIITQITRASQRYDCASPFILITLIETLESIDAQKAQRINSRGRLLQTSVTMLLNAVNTANQPKRDEVRLFLSAIACTARRTGQRNAIQLGRREQPISIYSLAETLIEWFDTHNFEENLYELPHSNDVVELLEIAQDAGIITISRNGTLTFKHELIAEYFVANYLYTIHRHNPTSVPFGQDIFRDESSVAAWSEPVAFWAGLVGRPIQLASHLIEWANQYNASHPSQPIEMYYPLATSLACIGVIWPSSTEQDLSLPQSLINIMKTYIPDKEARENLAHIFKRCADEGGNEVYRSLPPLLSIIEGLEDFLLRLNELLIDKTTISDLLFDYLITFIANPTYAPQVDCIKRVLGCFNMTVNNSKAVIDRAMELCTPRYDSLLRAATIEILGLIRDIKVVETIINCLADQQDIVYKAAIRALMHLGSDLALNPLISKLNINTGIDERILIIFEYFLTSASTSNYRLIITAIISLLTHTLPPEVQVKAKEILSEQISMKDQTKTMHKDDLEKKKNTIQQLLISFRTSDNIQAEYIYKILYNRDIMVTPYIIAYWEDANTLSEKERQRIVKVLDPGKRRDTREAFDKKALDFLIRLLADKESEQVQKQLRSALCNYAPYSIQPLINLIVFPSSRSEAIPQQAAFILKTIGRQSVKPVCDALSEIREPGTHILVEILESLKSPVAIPVLINLLQQAEAEPQYIILAEYVITVLGQFRDEKVVTPLINTIAHHEPILAQRATRELSGLGDIALNALIAALDVEHETAVTSRIREALRMMQPFPQEQLVAAFIPSDARAIQIRRLFKEHATSETTQFLVSQILHPNPKIRSYINQTLEIMPSNLTAQPLVEALSNPGWQPTLAPHLHANSNSIPLLIQELGNTDRGDSAYATLLKFNDLQEIVPSLMLGLQNARTRLHTRRLIVDMVNKRANLLPQIIWLFDPATSSLPSISQESLTALQEVLIQEFADISLPEIIEALRERSLIKECSNTLALLAQQQGKIATVLQALLKALRTREELRLGAKQTLIQIGEPALEAVSSLLNDHSDTTMVEAGREMLAALGVRAFPKLYQLFHTPTLAPDARLILRRIPVKKLASGIVRYLASNKPQHIEVALFLLYTRIDEEERMNNVEIIPAMIQLAQQENNDFHCIIAAILLFRINIAKNIIDILETNPERYKEFFKVLPFIGESAIDPLVNIVNKQNIHELIRAEALAQLGIIRRDDLAVRYVARLARGEALTNVNSHRTRLLYSPLPYRALGGLLASGNYDPNELIRLRNASEPGSASYEFFDVLLGKRNVPELENTRRQLRQITTELNNTREQLDLMAQERDSAIQQIQQLKRLNNEQQQTITRQRDENARLHGGI